jgi:Fic family protein
MSDNAACIIKTHPWIKFDWSFVKCLTAPDWVLLGECASKIEHLKGTPLMPAVADRLNKAYITRGIQGTAAIEGNTLSEEQVALQLEGNLTLPPSQEYLQKEIANLQLAYNRIAESLSDSATAITEDELCGFNRLILNGLPSKPDVMPGGYANKQHGVGNYRAPSPSDIRRVMPCFFQWINHESWGEAVGTPVVSAILRAILAHLYIAWIHPFGDGNGRTARMIEADILARASVPAASYHLLSTHYNQTRTEYYRVLAQTHAHSEGSPEVFVRYAVQGLVDGLRQQIMEIKQQHREIVWRDYVHDRFRNQDTERYARLRKLAMDLAQQKEPVSKADLWRISSRVQDAYRDKTLKTVSRDLSELLEMQLVIRIGSGYSANTKLLDRFVPPFKTVAAKTGRRGQKR